MKSIRNLKAGLLGVFVIAVSVWGVSGTIMNVSGSADLIERIALPQTVATDEYIGSESCKACHEDQFNKFAGTVHGKIESSRWKGKAQGCES